MTRAPAAETQTLHETHAATARALEWQAPPLPKVAWGKGCYVYDTDGRQYIDGSAGPAVFSLGHAHEEVNTAIKDQLDRIAHGYRYTFTSDPLEELTALVAGNCGGGLRYMTFCSSGSEAVESCLKIALQYHAARGEMSRRRFIARERSWHGNTLGALAVSGFLDRRQVFEGALAPASLLSPANVYRPPAGLAADAAPAKVAQACAAELEAEILRCGPETIAAFIFEPVVGAAGGCVPAPPGYAKLVREICDRHDVLMIADEVMCGSGRCGTWRALETDGVEPDIMSVAKGLAGGYIPLSAAIYHERLRGVMFEAHGGLMTGHTFTGHTAACAAGVAVQKVIARDHLLRNVTEMGLYLRQLLQQTLGDRPYIGDIRGRGLFLGIELVGDKAGKEPFAPELKLNGRLREQAFENGLICYPVGGNVDGRMGDIVILSPPYIVTRAEIEEIVDKLQRSLTSVMKDVKGMA
ncbi:MAG TPA: aspartate aminotransferase family protein [Dongiaceae bacterium]|nr:aspartate aminotransferase family protein [Dongiaceae bacterium]